MFSYRQRSTNFKNKEKDSREEMSSQAPQKWTSPRVMQANTRKTDEKQAPKAAKESKAQEVPAEIPQSTTFESREATDTLSNLAQYSTPDTYELVDTMGILKPAELEESFHQKFKEQCKALSTS